MTGLSEGTLGVVVEADLSLVDLPSSTIGLAIPFPSVETALSFVVAARSEGERRARCLELFDEGALRLSAKHARTPWGDDARAMIYLEDVPSLESETEIVLDHWLQLSESHGAIESDIRAYQSSGDLRDARVMRHAVPAAMNELGASFRNAGGRKVSTDWAVPYERLGEALEISEQAVQKHGAPMPITYGHAGNGHPHQNFIAENPEALRRINAAVDETLQSVIGLGGTVSAEHGLGKLKRHWLSLQSTAKQIDVMKALKASLDPHGILAPGNIL